MKMIVLGADTQGDRQRRGVWEATDTKFPGARVCP